MQRWNRLTATAGRSLRAETSLQGRRTFFSTAFIAKEAQPAQTDASSSSATQPPPKGAAAADTSSCPAGTVLTGINIYKDRADPVAEPDSAYPSWLWTLLDAGKKSADGVTLESTEGLTKGEARMVEKRNLRAIRAAHRAKQRLDRRDISSSSGAGMHAVGQASQGIVGAPAGEAEAINADAATAVADEELAEREKKRELRKANRANIKARNFLKAQ